MFDSNVHLYKDIVNNMDTSIFYEQGKQHSMAGIPKMKKDYLFSLPGIPDFQRKLPKEFFTLLIDSFYAVYEIGYDDEKSNRIVY